MNFEKNLCDLTNLKSFQIHENLKVLLGEWSLLIATVSLSKGYYLGAPVLQFKNFHVHTFSCFLMSKWSDFGHAKTGSEKTAFEQKFALSLVVFCSHAAISLCFLLFFQFFWIGFFFLNAFPNPFINHSRPNFLFEPNFDFSLVVFCSHAAFWHWFSGVFLNFFIWFF